MDLWRRVQAEYAIQDVGGLEVLAQACQLVEALAEGQDHVSQPGAGA
jgi:hypothetical protein